MNVSAEVTLQIIYENEVKKESQLYKGKWPGGDLKIFKKNSLKILHSLTDKPGYLYYGKNIIGKIVIIEHIPKGMDNKALSKEWIFGSYVKYSKKFKWESRFHFPKIKTHAARSKPLDLYQRI
jgi:hypothetical protein